MQNEFLTSASDHNAMRGSEITLLPYKLKIIEQQTELGFNGLDNAQQKLMLGKNKTNQVSPVMAPLSDCS